MGVAHHPKNRQHLVLQGSVPLVKRTIEFYEAADASLPKPVPRPTAKALTLQAQPPPFLSKSKSQALLRYSGSVKDSWVANGVSLPALSSTLPFAKGRREPVDWFAGSPTAIASRVNQRGRTVVRSSDAPHKQRGVDWFVGSPAASALASAQNSSASLSATALRLAAHGTLPSKAVPRTSKPTADVNAMGNQETPFPSLMWLISEDGVDEQAFYRCCDKGTVVLQARWLLRDLETPQDDMHQPKTQTVEVRRNPVWDYTQKG